MCQDRANDYKVYLWNGGAKNVGRIKTMIKDIYKRNETQSFDNLLGYNHKHIQP